MHLYDYKDLVRTPFHHLQSGKQHDGGHRRKEQLIYQQLANHSCPARWPLWQYVCLQELQQGTLNISGGETNLNVQYIPAPASSPTYYQTGRWGPKLGTTPDSL